MQIKMSATDVLIVIVGMGKCRLLPHAKLGGTNREDTCRVNFSLNRLLVKPLSTGPLIGRCTLDL